MSVLLRRSIAMAMILAVFIAGWFGTLGGHRLLEPDEGRYAEIPREMAVSGDWVTPRLNAIKYFEKPPLQYWATAAAYEVFGTSEWSARLWTALTGFLGILLTFWLAWRLYGPMAALAASVVQAGSLLYVAMAHLTTLDMGLTFSLQLTLAGLVWLIHDKDHPERCRPGVALLAVGGALAFLSKGLIGILIPLAVAGLYLLVSRDWKLLLRSQPWWSLIALLVLAGPWLLEVSQTNPEFAHFFFVHEHFQRFLTRVHDRYQSDAFFIPILLVGFLPWTPLLPALAADAWRSWRAKDRVVQVLTLWTVFIFLFFSFSQSKLAPYILPIFPALALLAGRLLMNLPQKRVARALAISAGLWVLLAIAASVAGTWPGAAAWLEKSAGNAAPGIITAFWLAAASTVAAVFIANRGRLITAAIVAAAGTMSFTYLVLPSITKLPKRENVAAVLSHIHPHLTDATRLYCLRDYRQSLPFYLNRTCTLVGYRGELDFGLQQEPWRFIEDLPGFASRWNRDADAIALMSPAVYEELRQMNLPMRLIHSERTLVAIARQ